MGKIEVPADRYWGAQTQRSLENFKIGGEQIPARGHPRARRSSRRPRRRSTRELRRARRRRRRRPDRPAPPTRSSTASSTTTSRSSSGRPGSGTQTNMNVNEVISNRAIEMARRRDRARRSRSTRTTTSTERSRRTTRSRPRCTSPRSSVVRHRLLPGGEALCATRSTRRRARSPTIVKIGRTHLQDATPMTLGQEISGWVAQLDHGHARTSRPRCRTCYELALGGTAVGTGLNTPSGVRGPASRKRSRSSRASRS